jgi:competence protein ComGC
MYAAIWRALPGPTPVRVLLAILIVLAIVAVLFLWVFPWAEQHLPFLNVTVDEGSAAP